MADRGNRQSRRQRNDNFLDPFGDFNDDFFGMGGFGDMFGRQMNAFNAAFSKMDEFMKTDQQVPTDQGTFYCQSFSQTTLPNGVVETHRSTRTNNKHQEEHYKQIGDKRMVERMDKDL